jgi:CheY-like chemotaxis protein
MSDPHEAISLETRARLNAIGHDFNNLFTVINGYGDLLLKQLDDGDIREQVLEIREAGGRAAQLNQQLLALGRLPSDDADAVALSAPMPESGRSPADVPLREAGTLPTGSETVLFVEDQPEVSRVATRVLTKCGYTVLRASTGDDAVAQAKAFDGPIHLLITDMMLPGTNGRELAARFDAVRPGLRVLYLSGYSREHLVSQRLLSANDPFLAKPFQADELATAVRAAIGAVRERPSTILVVDDEDGVRKLLCGVLIGAGYDVLWAADGRQAQRIIQSRAIDLVLMDLVMPDREGIETIAELRREHPALKIVAISGFGGTFLQVARRLGARATLAKPISPDELLRVARDILAAD